LKAKHYVASLSGVSGYRVSGLVRALFDAAEEYE
jgi:hypothetical protein